MLSRFSLLLYTISYLLTKVRWVAVLQGLTRITVPRNGSVGAYMASGRSGLIFAADTPAVNCDGHRSQCIGTTGSILLQIPTQGGTVPAHTTLHMGPCRVGEMVGGLAPGLDS